MSYYNIRQSFFILSSTIKVEETQKIDRFLRLLEKSGVCDLLKSKIVHDDLNKGGRPSFNVYNMLAAIIYSFAFNKASLRNIEDMCMYDLRVIYIMENETPSYKTIGNFINDYIVPYRDKIFGLITKAIFEECNIKMDKAYIDGSKFEADANKYKFVWKPTTFHIKLSNKIRLLLNDYNIARGIQNEGIIDSKMIADKLIELNTIISSYDLSQKENKKHRDAYSSLYSYLEKSLEYEEKERICGPNRNSYFKTDKDATAMCLKEDYYSGLGSNMHAAYNVQLCVIYGIISSYIVTQSRNDMEDFIKIIEKHYEMYKIYPEAVCADAGYGSLKNYTFLEEHNIKNYVKYVTWEGNVSGKRPSQYRINRDNTITCLNGNIGVIASDIKTHPRKSNSLFYKIVGCNDCKFKDYCKRFMSDKSQNFKIFEVSQKLQNYIQEAENNLLSPTGIEMRVNRSSQVEGAFGVIKQDFMYERFRRTLIDKVSTEFMLVCLGYNIRKIFRFYSGKAKFEYWKAPDNLEAETFKKPSAKRLSNRVNRQRKKSPNEEAKSKYKY
jgi:transposase